MRFQLPNDLRGRIRLGVFILSCIVFLWAGYQLIQVFVGYHSSEQEYEDIREAVRGTAASTSSSDEAEGDDGESEEGSSDVASGNLEGTSEIEDAGQESHAFLSAEELAAILAEAELAEEGETFAEEPEGGDNGGSSGENTTAHIDFSTIDFGAYESPGKIYISGSALDVLVEYRYPMDFNYLLSINSEVVGWITVEGTNIDYPMVQAADNEKYLRMTLTGEWNNAGSIFVDYKVAQPFVSDNTIIHGHNQRNNMMFHEVVNYADADYFNNHQRILIYTPDGSCSTYQVFAFYKIPSHNVTYDCNYASKGEYQQYLNHIAANNWYNTGVQVTTDDRIITLSTCSNEWDDTRYVIHAKKIS